QEHDHALPLAGLHHPLDRSLLFEVHGARRGSDEALGHLVDDPAPRPLDARSERGRGYAVPLAEREHQFVLQLEHLIHPLHELSTSFPRSRLHTLSTVQRPAFRSSTTLAPSPIVVMRPRNKLPLATSCTRPSVPPARPAKACGRYG